MTLTIGILIFDETEVLDLAGPYEVFSVASRMAGRRGEPVPLRPLMIAKTLDPSVARGGFRALPDATQTDHPALDVLPISGGVPTQGEQDADALAGTGLLVGQTVTPHREDQAELAARFERLRVQADCAWVDAGDIITSGGISAGTKMSLHLVERLHSRELALATARQKDYTWHSIENGSR